MKWAAGVNLWLREAYIKGSVLVPAPLSSGSVECSWREPSSAESRESHSDGRLTVMGRDGDFSESEGNSASISAASAEESTLAVVLILEAGVTGGVIYDIRVLVFRERLDL